MSYRPLIVLLALFMAGCVQMSNRYVSGTEYDRAVILYENGRLAEAREKAKAIPREDPSYKAARKLLADINTVAMQLSRRHTELGEDYERAGIYSKAVAEYNKALVNNPANILARNRLEVLTEAMKNGENPDSSKKNSKGDPEDMANIHYLKGKIYLDSKAYSKAIEEFGAALKAVPAYMNAKDLLAKAKKEREKAIDSRLKKGIAYFQSEEMELAVKEWDAVLELDPSNRVAADYKYRAEVIMERLRKIREKQALQEQPL